MEITLYEICYDPVTDCYHKGSLMKGWMTDRVYRGKTVWEHDVKAIDDEYVIVDAVDGLPSFFLKKELYQG